MSDIVVTVPRDRWEDWIAEGDAVGAPASGDEWGFFLYACERPPIDRGERLYIVAHGRVRGYAPVTRVQWSAAERAWVICRRGGAVAVTILTPAQGFRGWRRKWWTHAHEVPFSAWRTEDVPPRMAARIADQPRRGLFP